MNKNLRLLLFGAGAIVAASFLFRNRIATFNQGTPFEGTGAVGALGNLTNEASGGILGNIGSAIGGFFADVRETVVGEGEIDCSHFNRATARGEDLYQRCIRGEL